MSDQEHDEEIEKVEEAIPAAPEAVDFEDKYYRALAEMENMRKRMQKERQEMTKFSIENVICEFLSPLDNFENALGFTDHMSDETKNWAQGFAMILSQFKDVLSCRGVTTYASEGMKFDPHLHEAVEMQERDDVAENIIIKELVRGYKSGDRVLRAARVIVSKSPAPKKDVEEEEVCKINNHEES